MSSHRLKSISKINAKSAVNENITIDAKHNDMVKYFKDLQKSVPNLKNELKNLVNLYKNFDITGKTEFEIIMEKNNLRDKINDLKEKINSIVEKEEENKYYLEVGVLLHNYYDIMETSKNNINNNSNEFEKNLLHANNDNDNDDDNDEDENDDCSITSHDDENDEIMTPTPPKQVVYKSVLNFFNERETVETKAEPKDDNKKDNGYTSMKISDFVKEESVVKKKIILDEYLKKIDPNYVTKIKIDVNTCKCPTCKVEMVLYPSDGIQICEKCGLQENILIESDKPSFKDPPMEVSYFSYKRINHYNEFGSKRQKVLNEYLHFISYIKLCINSILNLL